MTKWFRAQANAANAATTSAVRKKLNQSRFIASESKLDNFNLDLKNCFDLNDL